MSTSVEVTTSTAEPGEGREDGGRGGGRERRGGRGGGRERRGGRGGGEGERGKGRGGGGGEGEREGEMVLHCIYTQSIPLLPHPTFLVPGELDIVCSVEAATSDNGPSPLQLGILVHPHK